MTQEYTPGAHPGAADDSARHEAAFGDTSFSRSADDSHSSGASSSEPAPFAAGMDLDSSDSSKSAKKRPRRRSRGRRRPEGEAAEAEDSRAEPASDEEPKKPARKRTRRRKKAPASATEETVEAEAAPQFEDEPKKKRSRRGKRGSKKTSAAAEEEPVSDTPERVEVEESSDEPKRKSRRRGGRGRGKKASEEAGSEESLTQEPLAEDDSASDEDQGKPRSRRRGKRGGRRRSKTRDSEDAVAVDVIPGEIDDLPELPDLPDDTEILEAPAKKTKRKTKRKTTRKTAGKKAAEAVSEVEEPEVRTGMILVNALDHDEQRVAVVEDGRIMDFDMNVETKRSHVGDIYRGRVVNLEPAIGAAFVDFGRGRNGFLHTSDVLSAYGEKDWSLEKLLTTQVDPDEWEDESSQPSVVTEMGDDEGSSKSADAKKDKRKGAGGRGKPKFRARQRLPITDLLKKGQQVVVQVTKDAIGDKGPTLTTYISIPGRYLVLMPSMARRGVSRKIEDDKERRRLKRIVDTLKSPDGMGVIVRTAGVGRTKIALKRDLEYLLGVWEAFGRCLRIGSGPAALYQESDVAIRTMRDLYSTNIEAVVVDDEEIHKSIVEFADRLMPEAVERVKLHEGARPLFHAHGVEQDYEKIFSRRVDLPSGGSIVLDQTEALVAIDVNSGRTRSSGFDFEAIALKTNMEAVPEIARQIRLRDLGGIIVVDFIDMMKRPNGRSVERAFRDEMVRDRARSKLGRISQFGLLEMTRQRLGPGLDKKVFTTCPRCRGTARIRTVESRASAILRRLGSALTLKGFSRVEVRAHPEVVDYLNRDCQVELDRLKNRHQRELSFTAVPDQPEDSVLRYLRADGREVRPGGRRKN